MTFVRVASADPLRRGRLFSCVLNSVVRTRVVINALHVRPDMTRVSVITFVLVQS